MELFWSLRVLYMRGKFKKPFAKKNDYTVRRRNKFNSLKGSDGCARGNSSSRLR